MLKLQSFIFDFVKIHGKHSVFTNYSIRYPQDFFIKVKYNIHSSLKKRLWSGKTVNEGKNLMFQRLLSLHTKKT